MRNINPKPCWNEYFMIMAKITATRSTCTSRPVGAVIVKDRHILASGYNGAPQDEWHCADVGECYWRKQVEQGQVKEGVNPSDLSRAIHAEINAIGQAAKLGVSTEGATLYTTLSPCINCFKAIVAAGISAVYYEHLYDYNENMKITLLGLYTTYSKNVYVGQIQPRAEILYAVSQSILSPTSARQHDQYKTYTINGE